MPRKLDRSPLLLEFKRILAEKASGTLEVKSPDLQKSLRFSDGVIVRAQSSFHDDGLTAILQNCGLISGDVLYEDDELFADLLVRRGILQNGEVEFAHLHRMRRIAISLFSIPGGTWSFYPEDPLPSGEIHGSVHPADILSDVIPSMENIYYFREIFSRSTPRFTTLTPKSAARVYERQYSLFQRMRRLDSVSHAEIRDHLGISEEDYWETLTLFFLLGGVSFPETPISDETKHRREMICRWYDRMESGTLDLYDLLGVSPDADSDEVEKAHKIRSRQFHPDTLRIPRDSDLHGVSLKILKRMEEARVALSHPPDWEKPEPFADVHSDTAMENPVKKARVLFQEALEHKAASRFADGSRCLENAIRLDPERAKYYYQLGLCQMHIPSLRKNAEQNLKKAAEMEPWNADPMYSLGVLFRSAGLRRLSEKYFRSALEINMDHTKAGRALRDITSEPRKGRLGKLFKP